MKLLLPIAIILLSFVVASAQTAPAPKGPEAITLDRVWIDYDFVQGGRTGLRIHAALTVRGMKGQTAKLRLSLLDSDDTPLLDNDGEFEVDGIVGAVKDLPVTTDPAVFKDVAFFVPYTQFDLEDGEYDLGADIDVLDAKGGMISHLKIEPFEYAQGEEGDNGVSAVVQNLTIQQNVKKDGRMGMVVKFTLDQVKGLKGVLCVLAARVFDMDDSPISASSDSWATESGHLVSIMTMKPAYDSVKFENVELFIPYDEFVVPKGTRKLKIDLDIMTPEWETIEHLENIEFEMTKR